MKIQKAFVCGLFAVIFALAFIGCPDVSDSELSLSGKVTIDKDSATVGDTLTATYSGSENVTYQWKWGKANVGTRSTTSKEHTAWQAGSYTVTVSAEGYASKTSSAVTVEAGETLAAQLARYLDEDNVEDGETYTLTATANETIAKQSLKYTNRNNITLIIEGLGVERIISLTGNESLFTVDSGVTLVLDSNITLKGKSDNTGPLVYVYTGGALEMKTGAKITGNVYAAGGGARVQNGGTFTMDGGEISGNTAAYGGGGVWVDGGGTFTMNGGKISGNTSPTNYYPGGGVRVEQLGTFTMNGGEISGNTGCGVYVEQDGTFRIVTGTVYGSAAAQGLRNDASYGAALTGTTHEYGIFSGDVWVPKGVLVTTNETIKVENGVLSLPLAIPLAKQLEFFLNENNVQNGETYTVEINDDGIIYDTLPTLQYTSLSNITIIFKGIGAERIIGRPLTVGSGVKLVLDSNITLQGRQVTVNAGGALEMKEGAKITGNTEMYGRGGGVSVNGGTFTMSGGEISGNAVNYGGGVHVMENGIFTMNNGEITGNTGANYGGGVCVMENGSFTMNGGKISDNTTTSTYGYGGGVYVEDNGSFTMNYGEITGNTSFYGGGVGTSGTFTMNGGEISGNIGRGEGGGVCINAGTFTMYSGEIFGNTAQTNGGGVCIPGSANSQLFRIVTGKVYGSDAAEGKRNIITINSGTGVALYASAGKAEYGTFDTNDEWVRANGLTTTENTIDVLDGVLQ